MPKNLLEALRFCVKPVSPSNQRLMKFPLIYVDLEYEEDDLFEITYDEWFHDVDVQHTIGPLREGGAQFRPCSLELVSADSIIDVIKLIDSRDLAVRISGSSKKMTSPVTVGFHARRFLNWAVAVDKSGRSIYWPGLGVHPRLETKEELSQLKNDLLAVVKAVFKSKNERGGKRKTVGKTTVGKSLLN